MKMQPGTLIDDKYEILSPIGSGGFGTVYRAKHLALDRIVALKIVNTALVDDSEHIARFEREAKAISVLRHRNIVSIYGYGVWHGAPYMVLELLAGNSLEVVLADGTPLAATTTVRVMSQVCAGLACAHQNGVVHRDLKASNILLVNEGGEMVIKIIDFGLAKLMPGSGIAIQRITEAGYALGTCSYMSPEQCTATEVDHRADVYAVGCILYQCLTGKLPFEGDNAAVVMYQHLNEPAVPIEVIQPSFSGFSDLQLILDRALAKNPDDRYQSIDLMAEELVSAKVPSPQTQTSTYRLLKSDSAKQNAFNERVNHPQRDSKKIKSMCLFAALAVVVASIFINLAQSTFDKREPEDFRSASDMVRDAFLLKRDKRTRLAAKELCGKALIKHEQDQTLNAAQLHEVYFELCDHALYYGKLQETLDLGRKADALVPAARRLTMTSPTYGTATMEASALVHLGRPAEAISRLKSEIEECKRTKEVFGVEQCHVNLSKILYVMNDMTSIYEVLNYELKHPNNYHNKRFELLTLLGDLFVTKGLYDDATTAYAARVDPDIPENLDDPNVAYARLWIAKKNWQKANKAWEKVIVNGRTLTPTSYLIQSTLMAHNGDIDASRTAYKKAVKTLTEPPSQAYTLFLYDINLCRAALIASGHAQLERELQRETAELQRQAFVRTDPDAKLMRACVAK